MAPDLGFGRSQHVGLGYLHLQGADDPEDLSSEVFLGVFRGLDRFEGTEAAFRSWVFAIAHHRIIDERRWWTRRPKTRPDDLAALEVASSADTETAALAAVETARVTQLCRRLAPEQRGVLLLRLIGELSLEHTAAALDKPIGSVKSLQHRALANLQKHLAKENRPEGVSR